MAARGHRHDDQQQNKAADDGEDVPGPVPLFGGGGVPPLGGVLHPGGGGAPPLGGVPPPPDGGWLGGGVPWLAFGINLGPLGGGGSVVIAVLLSEVSRE